MNEPKKYRKKPVEIDALRWRGDNFEAVIDFVGPDVFVDRGDRVVINTLEGQMKADVGDYILRGVKGEFYPCKPDIFDATYDAVNREAD